MALRRNLRNEDGVGQPERSSYGKAARTLVPAPVQPVVAHNVRNGAHGFRDRFGVMLNAVPMPPPLVAPATGYAGRLPLSVMPRLTRPHAWES